VHSIATFVAPPQGWFALQPRPVPALTALRCGDVLDDDKLNEVAYAICESADRVPQQIGGNQQPC
jgi:hypothetical protein